MGDPPEGPTADRTYAEDHPFVLIRPQGIELVPGANADEALSSGTAPVLMRSLSQYLAVLQPRVIRLLAMRGRHATLVVAATLSPEPG